MNTANPFKRYVRFSWGCFNVEKDLPDNWRSLVLDCALSQFKDKMIIATSVTSREASPSIRIRTQIVGGVSVREHLPWLFDLYQGLFRKLASDWAATDVFPAQDDRYAINLNVQQGTGMRYECHVDSNPVEGLLYVTDHLQGDGGELVVANRRGVWGCKKIDQDSVKIFPSSGNLIFFDASQHPHYVMPLKSQKAVRVAVAMNYYTNELPESARPADLNKHLGIE